jgi:hypothetical protein
MLSHWNKFHSAVVSKAFTDENHGRASERATSDPRCLSRIVVFVRANTSKLHLSKKISVPVRDLNLSKSCHLTEVIVRQR